MKNVKNILLLAGILITIQSCEDQEKIRFPEFVDAAVMRIQVDPDFASLDASDIENAKIVYNIFTENTNIESVILSATYYNFQNDTSYERREIRSYTQADFDSHNLSIFDEEFTSSFLADVFGLPNGTDDMGGGDRFDFFNVTSLTNGMVFPDTILSETEFETINVTPNIVNSAATTSFSVGFTAYVACPIPDGFATGDYYMEQISGPADPWGGTSYRWAPGIVTLTEESPIERKFTGFTYFGFDGREFNFLLVCGNVLVGAVDARLGCSAGLVWGLDSPPGYYDESDDSEIYIHILENILGDCGLPTAEPAVIKLTKIN